MAEEQTMFGTRNPDKKGPRKTTPPRNPRPKRNDR
jgi:hypothetical protein